MNTPNFFKGLPDGKKFDVIFNSDESVLNYLADLHDPLILKGVDETNRKGKDAWLLFYKQKSKDLKPPLYILIVFNVRLDLNNEKNKYIVFHSEDLAEMLLFFKRWYKSELLDIEEDKDNTQLIRDLQDIIGLVTYHCDNETIHTGQQIY